MSISKKNAEGYADPTAYQALTSVLREEKAKTRAANRPLVFICSPYAGDVKQNVKNARRYSRFAVEQGAIPVTPHLLYTQFMDDNDKAERELGLLFGKVLLSKCDEVWVFGNKLSSGMKQETVKARTWGKPVKYFDADSLTFALAKIDKVDCSGVRR